MAEALGVTPTTVGNYTSGRTKPSKLVVKEWAVRTGAPLSWLLTGETETPAAPVTRAGVGAAGKRTLYFVDGGPAGIEPTTSTVKARRLT